MKQLEFIGENYFGKWVSRYFTGTVEGNGEVNLMERKKAVGEVKTYDSI